VSSLQGYDAALDYSYAPGLFPAMECLLKRPEKVRRVLVHSKAQDLGKLKAICAEKHIRVEEADRALARISGKDNCFAAAVFEKFQGALADSESHMVLHHPGDQGNVGTILRTCLGLGLKNIAVIRPCADVFDPKVIRASMGAIFALNLKVYDDFAAYRAEFPRHYLYPFMLGGAVSLNEVKIEKPYALVFGNEGKGLPEEFEKMGQAVRIPHSDAIDSLNLAVAAAIGAYFFVNKEGV
jgi:rRNA methylases